MRCTLIGLCAIVLVGCASAPDAAPPVLIDLLACPSEDGTAFYVNGRKVAKPSVAAAVLSEAPDGAATAGVVLRADGNVRYGDVSQVFTRLRVLFLDSVSMQTIPANQSPCRAMAAPTPRR